jgi:glycosyltransferase involved in cell wall biosynthesis
MKLGIVVPCYNEEEVLRETAKRLLPVLDRLAAAGKVSPESRIFFVDDGSRDKTWSLIEALGQEDPRVAGIKLSRNRGHQNALLAGLFTASGDALVSIDADLQDDVTVIEQMVDAHLGGADVVYGVRKTRESDSVFKRNTALGFYGLMRSLGADVIENHADFRLMSRRAIEALKEFREVNLFLRGLVPLVGFPSEIIYYDRAARFAGVSKYPLRRMISFALEGLTSFSVGPLRLITMTGLVVFLLSMFMSVFIVGVKLFSTRAVPGWASTVLPVYFIGGIQILCIGVIGEYIGKIYKETKARPRYIIEKSFNL